MVAQAHNPTFEWGVEGGVEAGESEFKVIHCYRGDQPGLRRDPISKTPKAKT